MNFPIFVLEGPDCAGKTTLANHFESEYNAINLHLTYRFKEHMFLYHTAALELALRWSETRPVVIDRWWPSEIVYANVYRKGSTMLHAAQMLDRVARRYGITYVLCNPQDKEKWHARFEESRAKGLEMYDSVETIHEEYNKIYSIYFNRAQCRNDVFSYCIDDEGKNMPGFVNDVYFAATDELATLKTRKGWLDRDSRYFNGPIDPKVLLLGDRSNPKTRREVWPFFENANSSLWLEQQLYEFNGEPISMFNTTDAGMKPLLFELRDYLNDVTTKPVIIPMGNNAREIAWSLKLDVPKYAAHIHHPQYYRRFQKDATSLKDAIRKALDQ